MTICIDHIIFWPICAPLDHPCFHRFIVMSNLNIDEYVYYTIVTIVRHVLFNYSCLILLHKYLSRDPKSIAVQKDCHLSIVQSSIAASFLIYHNHIRYLTHCLDSSFLRSSSHYFITTWSLEANRQIPECNRAVKCLWRVVAASWTHIYTHIPTWINYLDLSPYHPDGHNEGRTWV